MVAATGILAAFVLSGFAMLYSVVSDTKQELKTEMSRRFVEQKADTDRRFDRIESLLRK